jgi:hypothetical protein
MLDPMISTRTRTHDLLRTSTAPRAGADPALPAHADHCFMASTGAVTEIPLRCGCFHRSQTAAPDPAIPLSSAGTRAASSAAGLVGEPSSPSIDLLSRRGLS